MSRAIPFLIAAIVGLSGPTDAQDAPQLADADLTRLLHEELSGEIAKDHVIQISRHHRIQGSRGYRDAAQYVLDQLRGYGFGETEAFIESFPSDGRIQYQTWQSPSGWHITSAELRMVEPYDERIVGYPEVAMSVMTYSNAGDITAELVWVGRGTSDADYEGKDVAGKFVLATGYGGEVHRHAVLKHGAAGVVAYLDDDRAAEYPDMLQYTGMWPRTDELERVTFGFNLTNRQGERLRALLETGQRVVMRGRVDGPGLEPFFMDVVVATIPGAARAEEELVLSAHLDHPKESANDNASGSAALLDIARAVRNLIDSGRMDRPARTLRFLWVPEWYGTMAYIDAHPEMAGPALGGSVLANINMDMVGENLEILHSKLVITQTPASIPSALNDVVANMASTVDALNVRTPRGSLSAFNYRVTPYSGGSDHMMFIDRKIPGTMFSHSPDYTHHTSEDTPDKVDPVELERSELIAASAMLYLSNLTPRQASDLIHEVAANGAARLGKAARRARFWMLGVHGPSRERAWFEAESMVRHASGWEREAIRSVIWYNDAPPARGAASAAIRRINELNDDLIQALRVEAGVDEVPLRMPSGTRDRRIPVRETRGPLDFALPESRLSPDATRWYRSPNFPLSGTARFELVNFIDGERTVSDIRDALSAEFWPTPIEAVTRYLEDLVKVGVVSWK